VNKIKELRNGFGGFTLIELLVAVIIIAILTSVAIPQYTKMVEKSRMRDAEAKLALIFQAQRMYKLDNNTYATRVQLIPTYMPEPNTTVFSIAFSSVTATTFTATATRLAPGGKYVNGTISVNETFNGSTYTYDGVRYLVNGNPS
jgi:type IV pilus assembly protein PilE